MRAIRRISNEDIAPMFAMTLCVSLTYVKEKYDEEHPNKAQGVVGLAADPARTFMRVRLFIVYREPL